MIFEMSFLTNGSLETVDVAKQLLGCLLVNEIKGAVTSGYIVETEAYLGVEDQACHSYNYKRTPRMEAMYEPAGTIYIYKMHTHHLLNVVTKEEGNPQAVLIRAVEPLEGSSVMAERRGKRGTELTNGPGKLTKAMGITMEEHGTSILEPALRIDASEKRVPLIIEESERIGIPNKGIWTHTPLRFTVKGNPYVSRRKGTSRVDNGWDAVLH
ncbi:DNA-3-methyladenine glycosylase [Alkalibacterium kapii]|uniref:Putative 3-methyladenine DNA glycosylase n=1 Tax=Alkalibacterium kapii TaxID=426704 RepID=A0A511AT33_9LACT|nr:DNA-3-methyladenine glycosylase [Alkalibacterium kapii]GEK90882.1 putative 3-methyladenine DNA glycosylase [Alkalibacterium kapii]